MAAPDLTSTEALLGSALVDSAKAYRDLAEAVMTKVADGGTLLDVIEVAVDYLDGRDYLDDDSIALFERAKAAIGDPLKPPEFGPNFHWAAAPQAIEHHVARYRQKAARAARQLRWLESLQAARAVQVARGEWPPATPPDLGETASAAADAHESSVVGGASRLAPPATEVATGGAA